MERAETHTTGCSGSLEAMMSIVRETASNVPTDVPPNFSTTAIAYRPATISYILTYWSVAFTSSLTLTYSSMV